MKNFEFSLRCLSISNVAYTYSSDYYNSLYEESSGTPALWCVIESTTER